MQATLAGAALLMGLVGGPHCVAMCGAACTAVGGARRGTSRRALVWFQLGRLVGYSALGALAAASMQGLGWLSVQVSALRPIWTLTHVVAALLGLMLLLRARQPFWLEAGGHAVWRKVRGYLGKSGGGAPLVCGALWAFLPCGLLYSALLVAALAANAWEGAAVMALFAVGSGASLAAGSWLWLRMRGQEGARWAVRLAGLALFATSLWALWMGLAEGRAPWC